MKEALEIRMLGEFSISFGGRSVNSRSSRSSKLWVLLEYLVTFRGKTVTQDELIELLWPDGAGTDNPVNTLKTVLYRTRALLDELQYIDSKKIITYSRGAYGLNPDIPLSIDADRFDDLCREGSRHSLTDGKKIETLQKAAELYKGDYLPKSAHESWAVPIAAYYRSLYVSAVLELCGLLEEQSRFAEICDLAQRAVGIDAYVESFHQYLIRALAETGKPDAALSHYGYVTNLFYTQLGISPSPDLTALYKLVKQQTSNGMEMDLGVIKDTLGETDAPDGAFFCEYEFFKDIYRIEARAAARSGQSVCIALITASSPSGGKPPRRILNNAMKMLSDAVRHSLRRGDIYTRYSVSQYLVLLSTVSFETGSMVVERILGRFREEHPKSPVRIEYRLQPLDPVMI